MKVKAALDPTSSNLRQLGSGAAPDDELKSRPGGLDLPRCLPA
jgi:hypothetical protein